MNDLYALHLPRIRSQWTRDPTAPVHPGSAIVRRVRLVTPDGKEHNLGLSGMTDSHPASPQIVFTFLLTALAGILWWKFSHWTATSFLSFPQFLIALFALFGLPGTVVLRLLRVRVTFLEGLVVGLFLGMIITGLLYWLLALAGWPTLLWGWDSVCALAATRAAWRERIELGALFARIGYSHSGLLVILALG